MAKSLIGIDVNMMETVMAQGNGTVYFEQMPDNLIGKEEIVSPESLAKFLKAAKKKGKISGSNVAMILPEANTYFKVINAPLMNDEQIKINLPYEFKSYIGSDSVKFNYDYFIDEVINDEAGNPNGLKIVAAATRRDTTEEYARVFKRAGLNLKVAVPQEVSLINLMKKHAVKDKECALIGIGYDFTNVYLFKGSDLVATKVIEIGNHDIDNCIVKEFGIDDYLAGSYRESNHKDCLNKPEIKNIYDRIALEVVKTINFYRYENSDTTIDTAYFFDAGSSNDILVKTICESTGFNKGNIKDILPSSFRNKKASARCLTSIGLIV